MDCFTAKQKINNSPSPSCSVYLRYAGIFDSKPKFFSIVLTMTFVESHRENRLENVHIFSHVAVNWLENRNWCSRQTEQATGCALVLITSLRIPKRCLRSNLLLRAKPQCCSPLSQTPLHNPFPELLLSQRAYSSLCNDE